MTNAIFTTKDLVLARGGRRLCDPLSLRVNSGEIVIIKGPNGSGKTTLLRVLAGLTEAHSGQIAWQEDVEEAGEKAIFAGHNDAIKRALTLREDLQFWVRWRGGDSSGISNVIAQLDAESFADRPGAKLSAGQRRRWALARLILADRPLWLLDEPAAPLDTDGRVRLAHIVRQHVASGGAVIAATHEPLDWPVTATWQMTPPTPQARSNPAASTPSIATDLFEGVGSAS